MSELSTKKDELVSKIADLEVTLHDLKRQVHEQIEADQHEAINHLEDYIEQADHKYADLRDFLVNVINEIRGMFEHGSDKDNEGFRP